MPHREQFRPGDSEILASISKEVPLIFFSLETQLQLQILSKVAHDIRNLLSISKLANGSIDGTKTIEAHGLFWLWVLGAYEMVRTMHQCKKCFDVLAQNRIEDLYILLAKLRIPFAKQEIAKLQVGTNSGGTHGMTIVGTGSHGDDMQFRIAGQTFYAKSVIDQFDSAIGSIRAENIVQERAKKY